MRQCEGDGGRMATDAAVRSICPFTRKEWLWGFSTLPLNLKKLPDAKGRSVHKQVNSASALRHLVFFINYASGIQGTVVSYKKHLQEVTEEVYQWLKVCLYFSWQISEWFFWGEPTLSNNISNKIQLLCKYQVVYEFLMTCRGKVEIRLPKYWIGIYKSMAATNVLISECFQFRWSKI